MLGDRCSLESSVSLDFETRAASGQQTDLPELVSENLLRLGVLAGF